MILVPHIEPIVINRQTMGDKKIETQPCWLPFFLVALHPALLFPPSMTISITSIIVLTAQIEYLGQMRKCH